MTFELDWVSYRFEHLSECAELAEERFVLSVPCKASKKRVSGSVNSQKMLTG